MGIVDFILGLVAVALWLSWRSLRYDPLSRTPALTLVGTLKRANPPRFRGWQYVAALLALLAFRGLLYWQVGAPAGWHPKLNLFFVVLAFRGDTLPSALSYSVLGFLSLLLICWLWMIVLCLVSHDPADKDALLKLLRLQLGRLARWHWAVQVVAPFVIAALLWVVCQPWLQRIGVIGRVPSMEIILEQALLVCLGLLLTLKFLLPAVLALHFVCSYVYLGSNPLWDFVGNAARGLLRPLHRLPLTFGRLDLAPLVGVVLLLLVLEVAPRQILSSLRNAQRVVWPH